MDIDRTQTIWLSESSHCNYKLGSNWPNIAGLGEALQGAEYYAQEHHTKFSSLISINLRRRHYARSKDFNDWISESHIGYTFLLFIQVLLPSRLSYENELPLTSDLLKSIPEFSDFTNISQVIFWLYYYEK